MAAETELWDLIASRREGVLATIKPGGLPQLTNVLYLPEPGGRTVRISTTADRLKARVLARDPRAVLHVTGDSFWAYAVAEGHATLTPAAAEPGDQACRELLQVHTAFYGPQAEDAFFAEMVARRRLVIRLDLGHVYGVIATGGRRPLPVSLADLSHAGRLTMPVIAVVGAGPGLGLAIARRFGREGFRVALISRAQSKLDALTAELAADGIESAGFVGDVLDRASLRAALDAAAERFGRIDVLEYSPAPSGGAPDLARADVTEVTVENIQPQVEYYVYGGVTAAQAVLPGMLERGSGTLLFTTGASSLLVFSQMGNIGIGAAGLRNYVLALNAALADKGVYAAHVPLATWIGSGGPETQPAAIAEVYWELYTSRDQAERLYNTL